jgi:PE family
MTAPVDNVDVNASFPADIVSSIVFRRRQKKHTIFPLSGVAVALGEVVEAAGLKYRRTLVPAGPLEEVKVSLFVTTQPEVLQGAASSLSGIGDAMVARNTAAAAPTTALAPAASDIVSAMTAAQFGQHGVTYQQIAAQAAEVHEQLVAALRSGAGAYALTEAANAAASKA